PKEPLMHPPPDPTNPTPSHAERARTLAARAPDGALSTIATEPAGFPYGSLVLFALVGGDPVFLISQLAAHTGHLRASDRCSLLLREVGTNPLALGRVTLVGHAAPSADPEVRETFLARHPDARAYADFRDFAFWRMRVVAVRYIGGFGRMSWVDPADWAAAEPDPLADSADGICAHMNEDHADALPVYVRAYTNLGDVDQVTMTGIDRYGFELSAVTADGPRPVRIAFAAPVRDPEGARRELVGLLRRGRSA